MDPTLPDNIHSSGRFEVSVRPTRGAYLFVAVAIRLAMFVLGDFTPLRPSSVVIRDSLSGRRYLVQHYFDHSEAERRANQLRERIARYGHWDKSQGWDSDQPAKPAEP